MSTGFYAHTSRATGTVLTAAIYNSDHQNHITNANPTMHGGYSDNLTQHQLKSDPGGLGSEILAGNMALELEQLRFAIARIQGTTHWYTAPDTNLASIGGGTPLHLAFAATPLILRRTENTTAEVEYESIRSGSGVGNTLSRRLLGSAANAVAEVREYLGATELWRLTASLKTHQLLHHFNAGWQAGVSGAATILASISGYMEYTEVTAPASPAADKLRLYARDVSAVTRLCYKDSAGTEQILTSASAVPATIVEGVRLGTELENLGGGSEQHLPAGHVVTGWLGGSAPKGGGSQITSFFYKPIQQKISGVYATITG